MTSMNSLKCVRSLIPVETFPACHPSKRLCSGSRLFSGMDGATIGKSAAAKAAVLNHVKVQMFIIIFFFFYLKKISTFSLLFFFCATWNGFVSRVIRPESCHR